MTTLKAEKRDPQVKAKKLRREGFVTGVLYGKEMKENVALKFEEKEALRFMKDAKEGAQAALDIEGETVNAMVKNIDYDPMSKKVLALDFQALVAGEVVSATVPVHFLNEEIVQGVFEPELSEIHYKADPAHLLDPIEAAMFPPQLIPSCSILRISSRQMMTMQKRKMTQLLLIKRLLKSDCRLWCPPVGGHFFIGFSRLRTLEFFVFRKMEMSETKNHPLCGWSQQCYTKNHLSVRIELFRLLC